MFSTTFIETCKQLEIIKSLICLVHFRRAFEDIRQKCGTSGLGIYKYEESCF